MKAIPAGFSSDASEEMALVIALAERRLRPLGEAPFGPILGARAVSVCPLFVVVLVFNVAIPGGDR